MAGAIGSLAGIGMSAYSMQQQKKQMEAQRQAAMAAAAVNKRINNLYGRQARLEYERRTFEIFREEQRARSTSLATVVNQGAGGAGSQASALGGAYGQIGGQVGTAFVKNDQDFELYEKLQSLYNKLAAIQGGAGQQSTAMATSFGTFAGPLQKIAAAFGTLGGQ